MAKKKKSSKAEFVIGVNVDASPIIRTHDVQDSDAESTKLK